MTLPETMLQARKLQEYLMSSTRKMLRLVVETKRMLLIHEQFSSCLHPYKVYLAKTKFSFYKLIHVGIKGPSLHCNFYFYFLRYVEASSKWVLPHLAPSH